MDKFYEIKHYLLEARLKLDAKNKQAVKIVDDLIKIIDSEIILDNSLLTKREAEILVYASKGFTNREIASALSISPKTIEFHLKNVYQKTHSSGRAEAIVFAIKNKLI